MGLFNRIIKVLGLGGGETIPSKDIKKINSNYNEFEAIDTRDQVLQKSVIDAASAGANDMFAHDPEQQISAYKSYVYGNFNNNKFSRLRSWRDMASYTQISNAIDEIADAAINTDANGNIINLVYNGSGKSLSSDQKERIQIQFENFISLFDLENRGFDYYRKVIIDGELSWENIIDAKETRHGIIGVTPIPSETYEYLIDVRNEVHGIVVNAALIFNPTNNETGTDASYDIKKNDSFSKNTDFTGVNLRYTQYKTIDDKISVIPMPLSQITNVNSGILSNNSMYWLPILEKARLSYRQLTLLEDAIIIYRLVRAPERLVFNVATGRAPAHRANQIVKAMMDKYNTKKIYDPGTGTIANDYDVHQMMECLALDTKIKLLDGTSKTLSQMIDDHKNGIQNWTYSCHPVNGSVVPGIVSWAGITRRNAQMVEIELDNGEIIKCTPDHHFPVWHKGKIEAQDLIPGDSLIAFNERKQKVSTGSQLYDQVYNHETQSWEFTHRLVANFFSDTLCKPEIHNSKNCDGTFNVIHHKDYNRYNNTPTNLCFMNRKDHWKCHSDTLKDRWCNDTKYVNTMQDSNLRYWGIKSNRDTVKRLKTYRYSKALTNTLITIMRDNNKIMLKDVMVYLNNNPDNKFITEFKLLNKSLNTINSFTKVQTRHLIECAKYCGFTDFRQFRNFVFPQFSEPSRKRVYSHDMLKTLIDTINETGISNIVDLTKYFNTNFDTCKFVKCFKQANHGYKKNLNSIHRENITALCKSFGYTGFSQFKKTFQAHNHRVVSVRFLDKLEDTGTLTIDQEHTYHEYHTFALSCGVFTYNSFWFPKPEGSDGTTVNTLQTGQSLGQLDDLKYFQGKLYEALQVPYNRHPMSGNANNVMENANTITYEEYRFSKFVMRIQQRFASGLLKSFKTHLKLTGLWDAYKLTDRMLAFKFNPPSIYNLYEEQQMAAVLLENYQVVADREEFSKELAMKKYLHMSDSDITENNAKREKEQLRTAYMERKIDNISQTGIPNELPEEEEFEDEI